MDHDPQPHATKNSTTSSSVVIYQFPYNRPDPPTQPHSDWTTNRVPLTFLGPLQHIGTASALLDNLHIVANDYVYGDFGERGELAPDDRAAVSTPGWPLLLAG